MLRPALLLALVLAIPGTLDAQTATEREPWRSADWRATVYLGEHFAAVTVCQFRPVVWVRADLAAADTGWVGSHERDHVSLMRQFPTCEDFFQWRDANPANALFVEVRAFCAGARREYAEGRGDWLSLLYRHASMLGTYSWLGMRNTADGLAALTGYCMGPT